MNRPIIILQFFIVFAGFILCSCELETPDTAVATFVDLVPVAESSDPTSFCVRETVAGVDYLMVTVKNIGNVEAPITTTAITWIAADGLPDVQTLETPVLNADQEAELHFEMPHCAGTDCGFTIIVDSGADVVEHGGESNNTVEGFCLN